MNQNHKKDTQKSNADTRTSATDTQTSKIKYTITLPSSMGKIYSKSLVVDESKTGNTTDPQCQTVAGSISRILIKLKNDRKKNNDIPTFPYSNRKANGCKLTIHSEHTLIYNDTADIRRLIEARGLYISHLEVTGKVAGFENWLHLPADSTKLIMLTVDVEGDFTLDQTRFNHSSVLSEVNIKANNINIGESSASFHGVESLHSVILNATESITVGEGAFARSFCYNTQPSFHASANSVTLKQAAFKECTSLGKVEIEAQNKLRIEKECFASTMYLSSLEISKCTLNRTIATDAFWNSPMDLILPHSEKRRPFDTIFKLAYKATHFIHEIAKHLPIAIGLNRKDLEEAPTMLHEIYDRQNRLRYTPQCKAWVLCMNTDLLNRILYRQNKIDNKRSGFHCKIDNESLSLGLLLQIQSIRGVRNIITEFLQELLTREQYQKKINEQYKDLGSLIPKNEPGLYPRSC